MLAESVETWHLFVVMNNEPLIHVHKESRIGEYETYSSPLQVLTMHSTRDENGRRRLSADHAIFFNGKGAVRSYPNDEGGWRIGIIGSCGDNGQNNACLHFKDKEGAKDFLAEAAREMGYYLIPKSEE